MNILNCKEQGIPFWADNDGGLWCYLDGCKVKVEESHGMDRTEGQDAT